MGKRKLVLWGVPLLLVTAAACGLSLSGGERPLAKAQAFAERRPPKDLCSSRKAYQQVKARVFAEAEGIRGTGLSNLDLLSSFTSVRVEGPLMKSRDEELGVTVCTGRMVLLLPPGAERGMGGRRFLEADVEYAAVPAADGSGPVYQVRGADSIIYRLAAFNLQAGPANAFEPPVYAASENPDLAPMEALAPPEPFPAPPAVVPAALPFADEETPASQPKSAPASAKPHPVAPAKKPALAKIELPKKPPQATGKAIVAKPQARPEPASADKKAVKLATAKKPVPEKAKAEAGKAAKKSDPVSAKQKRTELASSKDKKPAKAKPKPEKPALVKNEQNKALATPAKKLDALAAKKPAATVKAAKLAKAEKPRKAAPPTKSAAVSLNKAAAAKAAMPAQPKTDCADARSTSDRLLCGNPQLAAKKRATTNFQNAAMEGADAEKRRLLSRTRSHFAAYVDRCGSESCIAEAYEQRMQEIRDIMGEAN